LRIIAIYAYDGPSVHSHQPVVEMEIDLEEYSGRLTSDLGDFNDLLLSAIPSLSNHHCSRGYEGGFVERLEEGTLLGHVIEHTAIELQALAGADVIYGKTRRRRRGVYNVVYEYECKPVGLEAGRMAVSAITNLTRGFRPHVAEMVARLKTLHREKGLGPSSRALAEAASRRGVPVVRLNEGSLLRLGYGCRQKKIRATITQDTSCVAVDIAKDKILTKQLLKLGGIPVPPGMEVDSVEQAVAESTRLPGPVVVKPRWGNQGRGVFLYLQDEDQITEAYEAAAKLCQGIMVEQQIQGRHYRVLVVGDRAVAAAERIPASVVGDGHRTVAELVESANEDPRRGEGHEYPLTKIRIDSAALLCLERQGLHLHHIPDEGQRVYLRDSANLSTGGTAIDVSGQLHPANATLCARAARLLGLDVAGVDLVMPSIARPMVDPGGEPSGAVIEVNASPGLRMHLFPSAGLPRDVAQDIIDCLFPAGADGRIPLVAVTGTNGKTTTVRLIRHILRQAGYMVGMTSTEGVYIGDHCVAKGDMTGPESARMVLSDPIVEAAVLETARGGIIKGGLAFDYCNVAVVLNVAADHLGQDGVETMADLAKVKCLLVERVLGSGKAVLNADDPRVLEMRRWCRGGIIPFTLQEDNVYLHKQLGDMQAAAYRSGNWLMWARGRSVMPLVSVRDLPMALGGRLVHHVQNALAAAAAALALGVPVPTVRSALTTFLPHEHNSGRFALFSLGGRVVVLDYGHNQPGIQASLSALRSLQGKRYIGVLGVPGDRRGIDIKSAGRTAARYLDRIVVKEDRDTRGRVRGETAQLLVSGVLQDGYPEEALDVVLDEEDAFRHALSISQPQDVLIVFFERYEPLLAILQEFAANRQLELEHGLCPGETGSQAFLNGKGAEGENPRIEEASPDMGL